ASASGEISWWSAIGASALGPRLWQPASHPPTSTTATHVRVRGCRGLEGWSLLSCVDPPASLECIDGDPTDRFAVGKRYRSQREKFPEIRGPTDVVERRHLETKGDPPRDRSPLLEWAVCPTAEPIVVRRSATGSRRRSAGAVSRTSSA